METLSVKTVDEEEGDNVGFNFFGLETSDSLIQPSKIKIIMTTPEDPAFKMEMISAINNGPYRFSWLMKEQEVVLAVRKKASLLTFELIY